MPGMAMPMEAMGVPPANMPTAVKGRKKRKVKGKKKMVKGR